MTEPILAGIPNYYLVCGTIYESAVYGLALWFFIAEGVMIVSGRLRMPSHTMCLYWGCFAFQISYPPIFRPAPLPRGTQTLHSTVSACLPILCLSFCC